MPVTISVMLVFLKDGGCLLKEQEALLQQEIVLVGLAIVLLEDSSGTWGMKTAVGNQLNVTQSNPPVYPLMILVALQPSIGLLLSIAVRMLGPWASLVAM